MKYYRFTPYILYFLLCAGIFCIADAEIITVHPEDDLQSAIDEASAGDTLLVESGIYSGNFFVNKSLTLQGSGFPILDGKNALNKDTLTLLADGIHLEGFEIRNSARAGINISSSENVIYNNEVVHNDRYGIVIWKGNNRIVGNNCSDTHGTISRIGIGIYLSNSPSTLVINNTLRDNKKNGIQASYSSFLHIKGNDISSTGGSPSSGYGIRVDNSGYLRVDDTRIVDSLTTGLYLYNASNSIIQGVTIVNSSTGIYLSGAENITCSQLVIQNATVGMDLSSSGSLFPNHVFRSSFFEISHYVHSTGSLTVWNTSTPLPYRFEGRYYENYTGNYWDLYTDSDKDEDGLGDGPYYLTAGVVDAYPLITPLPAYDWNPAPPDVTPPATVTELTGHSPDSTSFCWTWLDPPDQDLDHLLLYLNGTFLANLSPGVQTCALDSLTPSTEYTLSVLTEDTAGNVNLTEVHFTGTTRPLADPTPSPTETSPTQSETETPLPSPTETLLPPAPTSLPETTTIQTPIPLPTTTDVPSSPLTNRRNTRFIPPPASTDPIHTTTLADPTVTITPSVSERLTNLTISPSKAQEPAMIIHEKNMEVPAPYIVLPLAGAVIFVYLLLKKRI